MLASCTLSKGRFSDTWLERSTYKLFCLNNYFCKYSDLGRCDNKALLLPDASIDINLIPTFNTSYFKICSNVRNVIRECKYESHQIRSDSVSS